MENNIIYMKDIFMRKANIRKSCRRILKLMVELKKLDDIKSN